LRRAVFVEEGTMCFKYSETIDYKTE
jgi:hypothetical protein